MPLSSKAIVVLIASVVAALSIDKDSPWEVLEELVPVVASPFVKLGFATGAIQYLALSSYDVSGIRYVRALTSREQFVKFRNYKLPANGTMAITFPNSGSALLLQMLLQVHSSGKLEFENVHHHHAYVELDALNAKVLGCEDEPIKTLDNIKSDGENFKLFGTHLSILHCPPGENVRYVIMMRDPVDTLRSTYTSLLNKFGPHLTPSMDTIAKTFFTSIYNPDSWGPYYRQWWEQRGQANVHFLFYEDVLKNTTHELHRLDNFFKLDLDEADIRRIEERITPTYMEENEAKFGLPTCLSPWTGMRGIYYSGKGKKVKMSEWELSPEVKQELRMTYYTVFRGTTFPMDRYSQSLDS